MNKSYDVIIIGAGSVGNVTALILAENKFKVAVIDRFSSAGQGQNKAAIGGIRATHIEPSKIYLGQESLSFFKNYNDKYGYSIGWYQGGYLYPIYQENHKETLSKNVLIQQEYGLNINWFSSDEIKELVHGINDENLLGGTWSPDDGSASPVMSAQSFYKEALKLGVDYYFNEKVIDILKDSSKITGLKTDKNIFNAKWIINASGISATEIGNFTNTKIQLLPDSHEAGITEPVAKFLNPMIVDIRKDEGSSNYYFYQNHEGQIEFCITPDPPISGIDNRATSEFLPMVAKRMVNLLPKLASLRVRRTWRGIYPNTKDGSPIIAIDKNYEGMIHAVGMCGQGYMFGPGIGFLINRILLNKLNERDKFILERLSVDRDYSSNELLR